jgi:tetratricopeptide (TPR) repeat protein
MSLAAVTVLGGLIGGVGRTQEAAPAPATASADLAQGIQKLRSGAYDAAIDALNSTVRQWSSDPAHSADVARAYLYLSAAYLGLDSRLAARAAFKQALTTNPRLVPETEGFSADVIRAFRDMRKELKIEAPPPAPLGNPAAAPADGPPSVLAPSSDAELEKGVAQARAGDAEAGVSTLQAVIQRLGTDPQVRVLRTRAVLFLAVGHLRANRESAARLALVEALRLQPDLSLDAEQFPPRLLILFQSVVGDLKKSS